MHRLFATIPVLMLSAATAFAQPSKPAAKKDLVEFEMMTSPEVKAALAAGKTTALVYTGGTEQRGPQNVNGGHTLMGRETVRTIALKLGNAIALPVLPYTPNNASATLPGTIGLTPEILAMVLERITDEAIKTGFKNVILMGDHGGGQGQPNTYAEVAKKLDARYAPQGMHVYFCDEVYAKANADFDKMLEAKGLPRSSHAGIPDTSEMLYLGGDKGWVRKELIPTAVGNPVPPPGQRGRGRQGGGDAAATGAAGTPPETGAPAGERGRGRGQQPADPNAPPRINNGISGDARPSTAALGKQIFDLKVEYAVKQIQGFLSNQKTTPQ